MTYELKLVAIIMPVFNDESGLLQFLPVLTNKINEIESKSDRYKFRIVIVDDGSKIPVDQRKIENVMKTEQVPVYLLRHQINLGQGAALQTGIEFARNCLTTDRFVTMDSDGQHSEDDLMPMLDFLENTKVDIVFGNRFSTKASMGMPLSRKLVLKLAVAFEYWLTGIQLNDAHNGFRVFNLNCAKLIELKNNRMAHATEFKQIVKRKKLSYAEFPVMIKYTAETLMRGQSNAGSLIILKDLLRMYLFERSQ